MTRSLKLAGIPLFMLCMPNAHGFSAAQSPLHVSLVIRENCLVLSAMGGKPAHVPHVSCAFGTPYVVKLAPQDPTQPLPLASRLADRDRNGPIWTVAF